MNKTAPQIADDVLMKCALSVTPEGHKYDADMAALQKLQAINVAKRMQKSNTLGRYNNKGENPVDFLRALRFNLSTATGIGRHPIEEARHQAYVEKQHREGSNAWNPWGGALTPIPEEGPRGTAGFFSRYGEIK